ncbi:MAG TPA: ABC transporter permease [Streptosporangiaceae bacterium]|nr:ABC transporter permease [Streptosporangiaceae bacterium]
MIVYLVRRVLQAVVVLVLVSLIIFSFRWLVPGGPQQATLGVSPTAAGGGAAALRHDYGLGSPVIVQYLAWLGQVLHGNLGYSYQQSQSVGSLLAARLPRTLALTITATVLAIAVAVPVGLAQAVGRDSAADRILRALTYLGYGMPSFFLGTVLVLEFAVRLHWLGAEGPQEAGIAGVLTDWRALTLPVATLAIFICAVFARYTRAAAIESLGSDYIRTARGAGAPEPQVLRKHVLRNSLIPVITLAGLSLPQIFGGALIVESLFNIEGVGWGLWQAAVKHDFPVLLGFILVVAIAAVLGSLLADVGYMLADPRIRYYRR